jgi:tetratricopeptide (TPR) repeat protein
MSKRSQAKVVSTEATSCAPPFSGSDPCLVRSGTFLAGSIIVLAALVAYHNSFSGQFLAEDLSAITNNPSIRHWGSALSPPSYATTGGRPLLNLTFALNYALGGMNVWGYHAFNLLVHALAGLALFGLVRRTLLRPAMAGGRSEISDLRSEISRATMLAFFVAVIWVVHPLQTEAVTFISERAECLMGLFYLLTLYCFVRGVTEGGRREVEDGGQEIGTRSNATSNLRPLTSTIWLLASVLSCLLGAMTKEVIVTAPVMILLYDRTFVAGSFREAWRLRWQYYLGLACTWLSLAQLMTGTGLDERAVGFGQGITWWEYGLTSCRSIAMYLKLAIWPHPLVFDYGTDAIIVRHAAGIVPYALVLAVLLAGTAAALRRWPTIGFAGAWFFVILAPASSVVPVVLQPMAEHRMYLPLAAIIVLAVLGFHTLIGRSGLVVLAVVAVGLGWLTVGRNNDYRSELIMLNDVAAKCPDNERTQYNLGVILMGLHRIPEAISHYDAALQLKPDYALAHNNLGSALTWIPGRLPEAISHFETALRLNPDDAGTHYNLAGALIRIPGRTPEAISHYEAALRINPDYTDAHYNLGVVLSGIPGRLPEAIYHFEAVLRLNPDFAEAHYNLGWALANIPGRLPEAISHYEAALRLNPNFADAHGNLGAALANIPGRLPEAIFQDEAALKINPGLVEVHENLGAALLQQGHYSAACEEYKKVLQLAPGIAEGHVNLGLALEKMGRLNDAIAQFTAALQIQPVFPSAQRDLEIARDMLRKKHGKDLREPPAP